MKFNKSKFGIVPKVLACVTVFGAIGLIAPIANASPDEAVPAQDELTPEVTCVTVRPTRPFEGRAVDVWRCSNGLYHGEISHAQEGDFIEWADGSGGGRVPGGRTFANTGERPSLPSGSTVCAFLIDGDNACFD